MTNIVSKLSNTPYARKFAHEFRATFSRLQRWAALDNLDIIL